MQETTSGTICGRTPNSHKLVSLVGLSFSVPTAFIALGSNLGDRHANIARAFHALARIPQTSLSAVSTIYETAPVGPIPQASFLNAAAALRTNLAPYALLSALLDIEHQAGRVREQAPRWGPRTLDLDLLLYDEVIIRSEGLTLPHPRLHQRAFVLVPLAEIAPDLIIPGLGHTIYELRDAVLATTRQADVRPYALHNPAATTPIPEPAP